MKEIAVRKLRKEFRSIYSKKEQELAEFFPDKYDNKTYTWKFKLNDRIIELIYVFKTGIVVRCVRPF